MRQSLLRLLLVVSVGISGTAQASFLDQDKQAAVGQFADRIIFLMKDPAISFTTDRTLLLRPYINPEAPLEKKTDKLFHQADELIVNIEQYSMAVATQSTTGATEAEVIATLVEDLNVFRPIAVQYEAELGNYDERLQHVAAQESYLDALLAAQPIISTVGRHGQELLSDYEDTTAELARSIHEQLYKEYSDVVKFKDVIDGRRIQYLERVNTRTPNGASEEQAAIDQLNRLNRIRAVTQPYMEHFWATQRELQSTAAEVYFNTAKLRLTILVWVRAHAQLASGVVDGEAFDVLEYKNLIEEAAKFTKDAAS